MALILLIEDNDALRTMLRLTLNHFGHTVAEARNGKEGLDIFRRIAPDILITDIVMPEKEGFEVLMTLRKTKAKVKIIAMSGGGRLGAENYLRTAKLMGAVKVLAKPFSNEALIAEINELLSDSGGMAHPPARE
jgi:DNA-binding response OmpR family regulator